MFPRTTFGEVAFMNVFNLRMLAVRDPNAIRTLGHALPKRYNESCPLFFVSLSPLALTVDARDSVPEHQ